MPMLRGLLNDDEELRWGLDDLEAWLRQERIPHHAGGGTSVSTKALRVGRDQFRTRGAAAAGIAADVRDRKSVVSGKSVSVRVDLGGRRSFKKKNKDNVT